MCAVSNEKKMKRDVIAVNLGIRQAGTCSLHFHKSTTYKLKEWRFMVFPKALSKNRQKSGEKNL